MIVSGFFILFVSITLVSCDDGPALSSAEREAIQEKLDKFQILQDVIKSFLKPEAVVEERDDQCLPLGSVCSFTSGPRCCSIRTRCVIWDRLENMKWVSHCREYNGGVWVDEIGKFFSNLG